MTLLQIKAQIDNLGAYKQKKIEDYGKMEKDLFDKIRNKLMYQSEADLRLENFKKEAETHSNNEYSSIIRKIEEFEKSELESIKAEYETVTADDVAELNLLASMNVSEKELLEYLDKYKRNPLAIKKLHAIGSDNDIALPSYTFKEDRLASILQIFKQYAKTYHNAPIIDSYGSASDLAFTLVLAEDETTTILEEYTNHFDTALGLS